MPPPNATSRLHLIFVPGFGGFDLLGNLEYYAGTTDYFRRWLPRHRTEWATRIALHYFESLPTAGVRTRARRLREYIVKRVLRCEFQPHDRIALIGHSTGGLDIRQLLVDLAAQPAAPLRVRGVEDEQRHGGDPAPNPDQLFELISHVAFLSVPQRGTNIANWTRANEAGRRSLTALLRAAADLGDVPGIEGAHVGLALAVKSAQERFEPASREHLPGLLQAITDINAETAQRRSRDPFVAASGREALADVELWLGQTHSDFLAIDDLCCAEQPSLWRSVMAGGLKAFDAVQSATSIHFGADTSGRSTLARSDDAQRAAELASWAAHGILVRSYATVAQPPSGVRIPSGDAPCNLLAASTAALWPKADTDTPYQFVYAACASGPFVHALRERFAQPFGGGPLRELLPHENDGIVNSASMLWPNGDATLLVEGDHADIIGHYEPLTAPPGEDGRRHYGYDIFQSNSGFDRARFERVWGSIFEFCTT